MANATLQGMLYRLEPCLVVEDDSIILLDIEQTLKQFGLNDIRTATTASKGEALSEEKDIRLAILDYDLGPLGNSERLAERLSGHGVSVIFLTAYGSNVELPSSLQHIPVLAKPFSTEMLAKMLAKIGAGSCPDTAV
jgi:DNA-binding NtrC family response regulator